MTKKQEFLKNACDRFGLTIQLNVEVTLSSGNRTEADAVISQANRKSRMFIFENTMSSKEFQSLVDQGDGYASFDEPSANEEFDLENYAEMFRDWGFSV